MHELKTVKFVIDELAKAKPKKAKLILGRMNGSRENFLKIYREFVRGMDIENTELEIQEIPVKIRCLCGFNGKVDVKEHLHFVRCPKCSSIATVVQGNELEIQIER